jgi:hypothetical protein
MNLHRHKNLKLLCDTVWLWRELLSGMWRRVVWYKLTDVTEERKTVKSCSKYSKTLLSASSHGLLFDPEDDGNTIIRNVGKILSDYAASHSRRFHFNLSQFMVYSYQISYLIFLTFLAFILISRYINFTFGRVNFLLWCYICRFYTNMQWVQTVNSQ